MLRLSDLLEDVALVFAGGRNVVAQSSRFKEDDRLRSWVRLFGIVDLRDLHEFDSPHQLRDRNRLRVCQGFSYHIHPFARILHPFHRHATLSSNRVLKHLHGLRDPDVDGQLCLPSECDQGCGDSDKVPQQHVVR